MIASIVAVIHRLLPGPKVPLRYTLRNLQTRLVTTMVTCVAFVLVIGLVSGMLAFLRGMERLTETSGRPGNVMILSDGALDDWRYVADVTINRCIAFMSHPVATNSVASQSSNSG